jgi:C-terminal processing protease CtpA/Prc
VFATAAVTFPQAAFVLALAQGSVRLVEVAAEVPAEEVRISDLPGDVVSAVGKASITDRSAVGRIQGSEGQKVRMRQYARQVDAALRPALGASGVPLILAIPGGGTAAAILRYPV